MAVYDLNRDQLNDMERASGGITKRLDMGTVETGLVTDDIIIIGTLPRESVTIDIRALVTKGFNGDNPSFELGYYEFNTGSFVSIATVTTAAIDSDEITVVFPLPVSGNVDLAGAGYTGDRGSIWNGEVATLLALKWTGGATSPTVGELDIVTTHTYYGTKSGEYGSGYIPMTPYRR